MSETVQQQECQEVSHGADCELKRAAEPFQSHPCTTVSLSQKITSGYNLTDRVNRQKGWLQKGYLVSKNFVTHPFVTQTSHFFTYSHNRRQGHEGPPTHNGKNA